MHAFDRQTDSQADRILIARPRLHSMKRSKNEWLPKLNLYKNIFSSDWKMVSEDEESF